jgi:hypothetical protein
MNRFTPDTWWQALLRPIAMAAPDGNTYVEIMAPDLRFVFALLLLVMLLAMHKRIAQQPRGLLVVLGFVALSFVPWLLTSGNGRYFFPILLAIGPLCVGLACALPCSRSLQVACAVGMLVLQGLVVFDTPPWRSWSLTSWRAAPYFDIAVPADIAARPATFVTITSISYSLVYPQFHPASHWMNISAMPTDPAVSIEARKARALLAAADRLYLLVPSVPDYMTADKLPMPGLQDTIDRMLSVQRLALKRSSACIFMPSRALARMALGDFDKTRAEAAQKMGFWLCPLQYGAGALQNAPPPPAPELEAVFDKVEQDCPRFFPPGTAVTRKLTDGEMRDYAGADMKLYVMADGGVYYKYWRALNPERIGSILELRSPAFHMDCSYIRGRSGLPWQRQM